MPTAHHERPEKNRHIAYVPSIDGLRAVSIILVVLFHAYPASAPGGFIGVDVFFVISGYLISSIIFASLREGRFSFVEFYQRRVIRIFPALAATLALTLFLGLWYMTPNELRELSAHVQAGAGFYSNILLYLQAGYFDTDASLKPLLHLWSLGVEEQYYLVWPPLVVIAARFRSLRGAILAVLVLSFAANIFEMWRGNRVTAFYFPHTRIWELALGAALAYHRQYTLSAGLARFAARQPANLVAFAGVALLAAGVILIHPAREFPGWWALLPTVGTLLVVASGETSRVNRVLSHPALVGLGKISYPLYLTHWPLLVFWRMLDTRAEPYMPAVIVAGSVLWSALLYRLLERPVKRLPRAVATGALAAAVAVLGITGYKEQRTMPIPGRLADPYRLFDVARDLPTRWRQTFCFIDAISQVQHAPECVDPPAPGRDKLVVLWGDSFAAQLYPGFKALQDHGAPIRIAQFTQGSCPPILKTNSFRKACEGINDRVLAEIRRLKPAVLVVAADWVDDSKIPGLLPQLDRTLAALRGSGIPNVILVGVFPRWPLPLPRAVVNVMREEGTVVARYRMKPLDTSAVEREVERIAAPYPVKLWRPKELLCDAADCLTVVRDPQGQLHLTFFDIAHLTDYGSEYVVNAMAPALGIPR